MYTRAQLDLGEYRRASEALGPFGQGLETVVYVAMNKARAAEVLASESEKRFYHPKPMLAVLGYEPWHESSIEDELGISFKEKENFPFKDEQRFSADRLAALLWNKQMIAFGADRALYIGKQTSDNPAEKRVYSNGVPGPMRKLSAANPSLLIYTLDVYEPLIRVYKGGRILHSSIKDEVILVHESFGAALRGAGSLALKAAAFVLALPLPAYASKMSEFSIQST